MRDWVFFDTLRREIEAMNLDSAAELLGRRLGGGAAVLFLRDSAGDQMVAAARWGSASDAPLSMGDGVVGRAWQVGHAQSEDAEGEAGAASVAAPLWQEGAVVGVVWVLGVDASAAARVQAGADALAFALQAPSRPAEEAAPTRLVRAAEVLAERLRFGVCLWTPAGGLRFLNDRAHSQWPRAELELFGGAGADDGALPGTLVDDLLAGHLRDAVIAVQLPTLAPGVTRVHLQALSEGGAPAVLVLLEAPAAGVDLGAGLLPAAPRRSGRRSWVVALALHGPWPPDGLDLLCQRVLEQVGSSLRDGDATIGAADGCVWFTLQADDAASAERAARRLAARALTSLALHAGAGWVSAGMATLDDAPMDAAVDAAARAARFATQAANGVVVNWANPEHLAQLRRSEALLDQLTGSAPFEAMHLVYQPILALGSRRVVEAEALIRWAHPTLGPVGPTEFLPLARRAGRMLDLGEWVLRRALAQLAEWRDAGASVRMAINVDAEQLDSGDLPALLAALTRERRLAPDQVTLEVTEQAFVETTSSLETLRRLARAGYRLAIDDFGAGHSCLDRLVSLPARVAKLDRRLLPRRPDDPRRWPLYAGLVAVVRGTGLEVVAEGVEEADQLDTLGSLGVEAVQGFALGRPVSAPLFRRDFLEVP